MQYSGGDCTAVTLRVRYARSVHALHRERSAPLFWVVSLYLCASFMCRVFCMYAISSNARRTDRPVCVRIVFVVHVGGVPNGRATAYLTQSLAQIPQSLAQHFPCAKLSLVRLRFGTRRYTYRISPLSSSPHGERQNHNQHATVPSPVPLANWALIISFCAIDPTAWVLLCE